VSVPDEVLVTIDGPAGCGKSSVARDLARRLGAAVLDTGAMYRAAALLAIRSGVDPSQGDRVAALLGEHPISFDWGADPPRITLDGEPVEEEIRSAPVTAAASIVAGQAPVRMALVAAQRREAHRHLRLVSEGRDQGSVVFPDAIVRFFLDAPVEERARRRAGQLVAAGRPADERAIGEAIRRRDELDRTREVGPLVRPAGAVVIDTGSLSLEQVVDRLEQEVRRALAAADPGRGLPAERP
jgi:cytidylate kinase